MVLVYAIVIGIRIQVLNDIYSTIREQDSIVQ